MAYETEAANVIGPTDVVSDAISAALVDKIVAVPLIFKESVPANTAVKLWRKAGSLVAESINEAATYSFSASSEYTETSVSATAIKTVVMSKVTVEALRYKQMDNAKLSSLQGAAIARDLDDDVLALANGFTNGQTATSVLTPDDILTARYYVDNAEAGGSVLRAFISHKQRLDLMKHLVTSGAAYFTAPQNQSLVSGMTAPNGYVGSLGGIDFFAVSGLPTSGGDTIGCVFNPDLAFGGMYDSGVNTEVVWVGSGGMWWEVASWTFSKVVEWNDTAGCKLVSDT
jgi:hypothetical protein